MSHFETMPITSHNSKNNIASDNSAPKSTAAFGANAILATDNSSVDQNSNIYTQVAIDVKRWSQSFPYQFVLVKSANGQFYQDEFCKRWSYTLPIPPESLVTDMPFAIKVQSLQSGGILEENNGAPFRPIQLTGTTGVMPLKGSTPSNTNFPGIGGLFAAIFGGAINQGLQAVRTAESVAGGNFTGLTPPPNVISESDVTPDSTLGKSSGYYQIRQLTKFFENYAEFKKSAQGNSYHLAFANFKDQATYLVSPQRFTVSRSAQSPYEYLYNIQLMAYGRIAIGLANDQANRAFVPSVREANVLAKIQKTITDARQLIADSVDIVRAALLDVDQNLLEPVRQVVLFTKDIRGVPLTLADMPSALLQEAKEATVYAIGISEANSGTSQTLTNQSQQTIKSFQALANLGAQTSKVETAAGNIKQVTNTSISPANDPFHDPIGSFNLFNGITIASLNLPPVVIKKINQERARVQGLQRQDFEAIRDNILNSLANFSDAVGAGNPVYNATFGRSDQRRKKTPTLQDYDIIFAMNNIAEALDVLAATGETNQFKINTIDYVAGLATRSGIAFRTPRSKFAVPYPYGVTLEWLANQYLGDPDRWIEIATLNGLQYPFVDEVGFSIPLLSNGKDDEITITDSQNLYIGQQIYISSNSTARTQRHIVGIKRLPNNITILTVDGDQDMGRFTTLANAEIHAYLPNTVNSQMMLYLPSDEPSEVQDLNTKQVPQLNQFDQLLAVGGFDLLLTPNGDLAVTDNGDCRLAVGIQNIVQIARTYLSIVQGQLMHHPTVGLPIAVGQSLADTSAEDILSAAKNLFNFAPFDGVAAVKVDIIGYTCRITMAVNIIGQAQTIPIAFDIPLSNNP